MGGVTSAIQTQLDAKAPTANPTFTGDVTMPGTGIWNSSGNVGIGTTATGYRLQVAEDRAEFSTYILNANAAGSGLAIQAGGGTGSALRVQDKDNNPLLRVQANGKVGIGTPGPNSPLEVYSSTGPGGYGHLSLVRDSGHDPSDQSWGFSVQGLNEASVNALLLQGSNGLVAPATNVMSWTTSGNVGIGTTDPGSYRLYVNGNVAADGDVAASGTLTLSQNFSHRICLGQSYGVGMSNPPTTAQLNAAFPDKVMGSIYLTTGNYESTTSYLCVYTGSKWQCVALTPTL